MTSRCTGGCCRKFTINKSPGELAAQAAGGDADAAKIRDLLKLHSYSDDGETFLLRYDCKALLPNGDCSIYNERPDMCRRYPDGFQCSVEGCTYVGINA